MNIYISLLRGINVGGSKLLSMDALCDIYSGLGFTYIRTYLQSGNVVFASAVTDQLGLANQVEARITQVCGFHVDVTIRNRDEFSSIYLHNPFGEIAHSDPGHLHVGFLYQDPPEAAWKKLMVPSGSTEKYEPGLHSIYLYYPNGYAKAKLSSAYLERVLGVRITDRNWNTVTALHKIAEEIESTLR